MIDVYKYTHKLYDVQKPEFKIVTPGDAIKLRGHTLKLQKQRYRLAVRQNFLSNRVVNIWSNLPESVVCVPSVNLFKSRLDAHWYKYSLPTRLDPECQIAF